MVKAPCLLGFLFFLLSANLTAQVSRSANKDDGLPKQFPKGKDTIIYEVDIQQKDTMLFGKDQKFIFNEGKSKITSRIQIDNKLVNISFKNEDDLILNLQLKLTSHQNDTIPVYKIQDPTTISHMYIIKKITCDIKDIHVTDYVSVKGIAFCRNILKKLID